MEGGQIEIGFGIHEFFESILFHDTIVPTASDTFEPSFRVASLPVLGHSPECGPVGP